ncbi:endonuclease III [Flavipsychrobacter stenotrophus]|uniref:Endonuclease III n=1 Tax=Flavipsychrobacter stenotrophus TaxID=2077091 RepID=A0A2S7SU09_9BACT|nr:endonuclease III [Flavipsychrobacter stenotrophus]PQJ10409.1 endonuclease III [Flavipsychrobacter stenotrophus]
MTKKERYRFVLDWFQKHMPVAETELHYSNPYELLVAVILSAQCTDKRINMVTPALFERYPVPELLAKASFEDVEPYIRSVTFANNKTRHLIGMADMLVNKFHGVVPDTIEELVDLPGVGRKTANVIISVVYAKPGMAVDTHVFRVSARIGLTVKATTPLQTEQQLVANMPQELLAIAHHWLILHGRYICVAHRPKCEECGLKEVCKYYNSDMKYIVDPAYTRK